MKTRVQLVREASEFRGAANALLFGDAAEYAVALQQSIDADAALLALREDDE